MAEEKDEKKSNAGKSRAKKSDEKVEPKKARRSRSKKADDKVEAKSDDKAKSGNKAKAKSDDKAKSGNKAKARSGDKAKSGNKAEAKSDDKSDDKNEKKEAKKEDKKEAKKEDKKEKQPERKKLTKPQLKKHGIKRLTDLADKLRLDLEVKAETTKEGVRFDITGDDARVYLLAGGRSPQKLDAVQTWLRAALENDGDTRGNDIDVDVEGFRQEREERLVKMASTLAADTKRIDREVLVAGLNSFERRIVHRSLDEVGGIATESQGKGSFRKLRVEPK